MPAEPDVSRLLAELRSDQRRCWLAGDHRLVEAYLAVHPSLAGNDEALLDFIYSEVCLREELGETVKSEEYFRRFPQWKESLAPLFQVHEGLRESTPIPVTMAQFIKRLARSGLMSAAETIAFQQQLPADRQPKDARQFAQILVQKGKLTKYQAQAICQGKTKGLVFGEYVVLDKLGEGGMGVVLKAQHRRMKRFVAVKMIAEKAIGSPDAVKRFYREVEAAAKLNHPNIVQAYDASEHEGVHYLVMEHVEGKDLAAISEDRGPMAVHAAVECILQAARGLQYAHGKGIVHRDIKPGNLLMGKDGTVKILDMGLARIAGLMDDSGQDRLTSLGQAVGTCHYMAPEQAMDTHHADARADIYSLGCTLYRLLTGHVPYKGKTQLQVLMAHRESPVPSICKDRSDVPRELDALFQKMVAKKTEERYQSMAEVITALESFAGKRSLPAASVGAEATAALPRTDAPNLPQAPPPRRLGPAMAYTAEISRANPTCFLFLIDQSGSMAKRFGDDLNKTKAQGVADAINRLMETLITRCSKGDYIADRYLIGVIGYGGEVGLGFPIDALAGGVLQPVSLIDKNPLRVEERIRRRDDGTGRLLEERVMLPTWVEPKATGKTPMCAAFQAAYEVICGFVTQHPACFPPVVINITDGAATDGDAEQVLHWAMALRGVASQDGNVLLLNIHLSSRGERPILLPSNGLNLPDDQARLLFRMSSPLPPAMLRQAQIV
jgi:serine/threonine protein kinase/uncharacterized protein YegL